MLRFFLLSESARTPTQGSKKAAGLDLYAAHSVIVPGGGKALVPLDLAVIMPEGCYGRIAPRSGMSWKRHMGVGAGVIDADYRGNVKVLLFNHGKHDCKVEVGDRVAQLILERCIAPSDVRITESVGPPPSEEQSDRGAAGFGSTGQ